MKDNKKSLSKTAKGTLLPDEYQFDAQSKTDQGLAKRDQQQNNSQ